MTLTWVIIIAGAALFGLYLLGRMTPKARMRQPIIDTSTVPRMGKGSFVFPHMPNSAAFIYEFQSYSSTVCASIGTVSRAIDHISKIVQSLNAHGPAIQRAAAPALKRRARL